MNLLLAILEVLLVASASFFLVAALMDGRRLRRPAVRPEVHEPHGSVPAPALTPQITGQTALD